MDSTPFSGDGNSRGWTENTAFRNATPINHGRDALFAESEGIVLTVILVILCLVGLFANFSTFFTIATSKTLRKSPFNIFIMSLSVSDFISALNSPFQIYRSIWGYLEFHLPVGMCKLTVGVAQWTMFVTVQHILVFSVFRVFAIKYPMKIKKFTAKWAKIVAVFIWVEVFLGYALFYFIAATVVPYSPGRYKTACTAVSKAWRPVGEKYIAVALPVMLFGPFVGIFLCAVITTGALIRMRMNRACRSSSDSESSLSISAWDVLSSSDFEDLEVSLGLSSNDDRRTQETSALVQVTLIVFSFLFGYSLDAAYRMTKALDMRSIFSLRTKWLIVTVSYVCLRISECLNPIFYNLASSQLRKRTKKFLRIERETSSSSSNGSAGKGIALTKM